MIVSIVNMPDEGRNFTGEEPPAVLAMESDDITRFDNPLQYDLHALVVSDLLRVTGRVHIDIQCRCSRCAEFFPVRAQTDSFEVVRKISECGDYVDLTDDIRESILLAFSPYPVCKPDCKGLCMKCGANLNRGSCNCADEASPVWNALNGLTKDPL